MIREHKSCEQGLSDLLNYAHFVKEGVILNKDGDLVFLWFLVALRSKTIQSFFPAFYNELRIINAERCDL